MDKNIDPWIIEIEVISTMKWPLFLLDSKLEKLQVKIVFIPCQEGYCNNIKGMIKCLVSILEKLYICRPIIRGVAMTDLKVAIMVNAVHAKA